MDDAGQVHEQERQLERPPLRLHRGRVFSLHHAETLARGPGHGAIGQAKGGEDHWVGQELHPVRDALRGHGGTVQQLLSRLTPLRRQGRERAALRLDPGVDTA